MQDGYSRYTTAVAIPNKEAAVVANAVLNGWITKYGCPTTIHSDQGTEFKNVLWTELMDRLQITKTTTPAYNPQSNQVERFHRVLNSIFRIYMNREDKSWERFVSTACFAYNTKVQATTNLTPFEMFLGRKPKMPIDLIIPLPDQEYANEDDFVREVQLRFNSMYKHMQKFQNATYRRNARTYSGATTSYRINDKVWLFDKRPVKGKARKHTDQWTGPYRIVGIPAEVLVDITPAEHAGRTVTCHVTRIRPYLGGRSSNLPTTTKLRLNDELAEEISPAESWAEPVDNLTVPVYADSDPPPIQDRAAPTILPKRTLTPDKPQELQPEPQSSQNTQASEEPVLRKRTRDQTETSPITDKETKKVKRQGEKRNRDENQESIDGPPARRTRSARLKELRELVLESDDEGMDSDEPEPVSQLTPAAAAQSAVTIEITPASQVPTRGKAGAPGFDIRAAQSVTVEPGRTARVNLVLRAAVPPGWCLLLVSRARLAIEGITVEGGLIDYTGPIHCVLFNHTHSSRRIKKGERVCQGLVLPVPSVEWQTVEELEDTPPDEQSVGGPDDIPQDTTSTEPTTSTK